MLAELAVSDLGVIADLRVVFGAGMTAVTGETGAGKTLIVEAVSLLVGQRADATMVRAGADEAVVEGRLIGGGDEVVVRRVVPREGRSRAYVDGRLATAAQLAELGSRSIDLHGQHAHQSLLSTAAQREALDRFGGIDLEPVREADATLARIDTEVTALGGDEAASARELDVVRFQVEEIASAVIVDADEDERLRVAEDELANAAGRREAVANATATLADEGHARDLLAGASAILAAEPSLTDAAQRLSGLVAEVDDAVTDLRALADRIDDDPGRLAAVQERRRQLAELRRKYGPTLPEVTQFAASAQRRLDELVGREGRLAELTAERTEWQERRRRAAAIVARSRRQAGPRFAESVVGRLRTLALPHAALGVAIEGDDPGDGIRFLLAADGGELQPLAKVVSGGELARVMLALRLVLTQGPPTLLFDEVDAGIGGTAATAVGHALAEVSHRHQVLVVTHLPQVAACADHQVVVTKEGARDHVRTTAAIVTGDARVTELSRMLSGSADSAAAREHAAELLAGRRAS